MLCNKKTFPKCCQNAGYFCLDLNVLANNKETHNSALISLCLRVKLQHAIRQTHLKQFDPFAYHNAWVQVSILGALRQTCPFHGMFIHKMINIKSLTPKLDFVNKNKIQKLHCHKLMPDHIFICLIFVSLVVMLGITDVLASVLPCV